jgi:hypothetical protein
LIAAVRRADHHGRRGSAHLAAADDINKGMGDEWADVGQEEEDATVEISPAGLVQGANFTAALMFDFADPSAMLGMHQDKLLLRGNAEDDMEGIVQLAMGCVSAV